MWPFTQKQKSTPPDLPKPEMPVVQQSVLGDFQAKDHMGKAAALGAKGKSAIKEKRFDDAWRLFHEQKEEYRKHAARYGMTGRQTIALDASVHEDLANIRRMEDNHDDALIHLLYCVGSSPRPTQAQEKKITTYFERCKFKHVDIDDLQKLRRSPEANPDFILIRNTITKWKSEK